MVARKAFNFQNVRLREFLVDLTMVSYACLIGSIIFLALSYDAKKCSKKLKKSVRLISIYEVLRYEVLFHIRNYGIYHAGECYLLCLLAV
jgi:hypothetical protein